MSKFQVAAMNLNSNRTLRTNYCQSTPLTGNLRFNIQDGGKKL